ncbi:MAG TPA: hypothetical protein VF406_15535, partial [Thermodesulfobacteriota bacterium]
MRPLALLVLLLSCLVHAAPAYTQNLAVVDRPLATDTANVVDSGQVLAGVGAEYVRLPGQEALTSAPVLSSRVGIAGIAEFSATYRWLWRQSRDLPDTTGTGDLYLFGKLRLLDGLDDDGRPSVLPPTAIRLGVKLPNASARERLGTNNTDFSLLGLVTPRAGPVEVRLSGGLLIIESPTDPLAQTDAWAYSAALLVDLPGGVTPFVEYYGQTTNAPAFDFGEGRVGLRWARGRLGLDLSASMGFNGSRPLGATGELSRDWGVALGATYRFDLPGFGRTWGRP